MCDTVKPRGLFRFQGIEMQELELHKIRIDGGTQSRVELHHRTVEEYSEAMGEGAEFPPIVVFFDGSSYWLADGFHRYFAADHAGISSLPTDIRTGTQFDAQLFSYGVNSSHGLRRSNADKNKAVLGALQHPVSSKWSHNQIAKHCGVSHTFVNKVASSLETNSSEVNQERTYTTKHGTQAVMKTENIGKKKQAKAAEPKPQLPAPSVSTNAEPSPAVPESATEEYTEHDALLDQVTDLQAEVARLKSLVPEESEEGKEIYEALVKELKEANLLVDSLTISRDRLQAENAELKRQCAWLKKELQKLKP